VHFVGLYFIAEMIILWCSGIRAH